MKSKQPSNLTAFKGSFSDLIKLFKDDNRRELAKYFPIRNWKKTRYINENNELKNGIRKCFEWQYKRGLYIGSIDIDNKIKSLVKEVINPLFLYKSLIIKKEDAPNKHRNDNLYYCYDGFQVVLKEIKRRKKWWGWEYGCDHPEGPEGHANEDIQKAIKELRKNLKKIFQKNIKRSEYLVISDRCYYKSQVKN